MTVQIGNARDADSKPFVGLFRIYVRCDSLNSPINSRHTYMSRPAVRQQSGLKPQTRHVAHSLLLRLRYSIPVTDESRFPWLSVFRGEAPLIVSMPHTGVDIPQDIESGLISSWRARKDTDWWVNLLYDFAPTLGATVIRTAISRTVIDVNRDPSGASLYPGQATTELCPTTTFDGEPLYRPCQDPDEAEIAQRRTIFFDPYHEAMASEIERLRA